MKKLMRNINRFYKYYDQVHPFDNIKLTKVDMYNHDILMSVYEDIWVTMDYHEDTTSAEYKWILNLYGELGDYLATTPYKWQSQTMGNIVCTLGEVVRQAWGSLIHYHTLDLRWSYNKRGY
jgi:hypothetical protein